jgi:hypothetical protein
MDLAAPTGAAVRRWLAAAGLLAVAPVGPTRAADAEPKAALLVVVGAGGTPAYAQAFAEAANAWQAAARRGGAAVTVIGVDPAGDTPDRDRLRRALAAEARAADAPLWVALVGHGTFDGRDARFNLRGPDVTAAELAAWLAPARRPLVIVNSAPASAPFLAALSGPDRVIVTATSTAGEDGATRFNGAFAGAVAAPEADLDKDGQTSVLEAFLWASRQVAASYEAEGLLASEHALLDDDGDGRGTPAAFYEGLRPGRAPADGRPPDGARARQLALVPGPAERDWPAGWRRRRDELELRIGRLRQERERLGEDEYYRRLEPLALELARLYGRASAR